MGEPVGEQEVTGGEPQLPPRSRGVIALLEENCTVCMLCARECPDWCIYIDSHKETVEVPGASRTACAAEARMMARSMISGRLRWSRSWSAPT